MLLRKMNANNVNRIIGESALKHGYELYKAHAVSNVKIDDFGYVTAIVSGVRDYNCEVLIKNDQLIENSCDCDSLFGCEHVAALLYFLANEGVTVNTYKSLNKKNFEKSVLIADKLSLEDSHDLIRKFLRFQRNLSYFKRQYSDEFLSDDVDTIKYKLDELFVNNVKDNKVLLEGVDDFCASVNNYVNLSIKLIENGDFTNGMNLYETIVYDLNTIDKSNINNYYQTLIEKHLLVFYEKEFVNIIYSTEEKINLFNKFNQNNMNLLFKYLELESSYNEAKRIKYNEYLTDLSKYLEKADAEYKNSELFKEVFYQKLVLMAEIDLDNILKVLEKDHTYYKNCILLARLLIRKNRVSDAVNLLEEEISNNFDIHYLEPLYTMYRSLDVSKYISLLTEAYFNYDKYNIKYYELLKKSAYFDADKFFEHFDINSDSFPDSFYRILLDRKDYEKLLYVLAHINDFELLKRFNRYLIIDYNSEILAIYENITDREFYENGQSDKLKDYLDYFEMLPNAKEHYEELVRRYGL